MHIEVGFFESGLLYYLQIRVGILNLNGYLINDRVCSFIPLGVFFDIMEVVLWTNVVFFFNCMC